MNLRPNRVVERMSARFGQQQCVEIEIDRVSVVIGRLLEVDAVREQLPLELLRQNRAAEHAPTLSKCEFWKCRADVQQPERFAGKMRVRTEIGREIPLDVSRVEMQVFQ